MTTTSATIRHFGPPGCALSPAWVVELFDGVDLVEGSWRRGRPIGHNCDVLQGLRGFRLGMDFPNADGVEERIQM